MKNIKRFETFGSRKSTKKNRAILERRHFPEVPHIVNDIIGMLNEFSREAVSDGGNMTENKRAIIGFCSTLLTILKHRGDISKEDFQKLVKEFTEQMEYYSGWYNPGFLTRALGLDILSGKSRKHYDPTADY